MAARSTNTMAELLQRLLGDIAQGEALPDADIDLLTQLRATIVSALRRPVQKMMNGADLPGANQPDPAMQAMANAGPPPNPQMMRGGLVPSAPGGGAPNPDELRRMLAQ